MDKRTRIAAMAAILALSSPAAAQQATPPAAAGQKPVCIAPDARRADRMSWFNGFDPSDDLLSAWCRIQTLPGQKLRFNVLFRSTQVHRSWDTSFEGGTLPASRIVEIIQSLLPTKDGPVAGEDGMEFHRVLLNVVQLGAERTPGGRILGFPSIHPASRELFLSEPIQLRVKPVVLAGHPFALTVNLTPNLGALALGLQGQATDVVLQGWKGRMDAGNRFTGKCSAAIPYCEKLGEVVSFHAPWLVSGVTLEAEGENLTAVAASIMTQLGSSQSAFMKGSNPLAGFNAKSGKGSLTLTDGASTMRMEAQGGPGGTNRIVINWSVAEREGALYKRLDEIYTAFRNASKPKPDPKVMAPDSLGRL